MFEGYKSSSWGLKILVSAVIGILLSLGLCGLGAAAGDTKASPFFLISGVVVLGLSVLGVIVGTVWVVVEAIESRGQ